MVMGYLIRDLGRYALATVDTRNRYIQVHRLLQAAVREWLAEDQARMEQIRHHAQLVLAGALPSAALPEEGQPARQRLAELLPHLEPSRAIYSTDPRVCEWVIRQVRNQWLIGDHRAAAALGRRALDVWFDSLGRDHTQTLRLAAQVANPLRSLGRFEEAYELDADTLRRQREQLGEDDGYTLVTARNYGGDLRGLGRYQEAYESDRRTYDLCKSNRDLGEDNEATLRAGNNLGVSLNLAGRPAEALALASETYEKCRTALGRGHRFTWGVASNVALDLREMGHYQRSLDLLTEIRKELVLLQQQEESNAVLRADASLAITQRRLGNYAAAEALTRTTLNAYRQRYGERHPETMSCGANLACDLLALAETQPDRRDEAVELGKSNLEIYKARLGADHPFTLAAATNLVAILRNQGEMTEALKLGDETLRQLLERLGGAHPATVACRANRAGALSGLGRHRDAAAEDEKVHEAYLTLYGEDHPRVLCGRYNMALERTLAGDEEAEAALRDAMNGAEHKLGPRHPTCRTMASRRRIDFDLEMPPT
jgi:hypothetical protein